MAARRAAPDFLFTAEVPAPGYLLDEAWLEHNCSILDAVQRRTKVKILLALKAFSAFAVFPLLSRAKAGVLFGACASSPDEARLGREEFGGEVHVFSAAYASDEMTELLPLVDHISFNSLYQWRFFAPVIHDYERTSGRSISCAIRINPEHSEGTVPLYDPCHPSSRLGVRVKDFDRQVFSEGITGLHFHTLCEQNADALKRTMEVVEQKFAPDLVRSSFVNLGGGHHITRPDYDLELLCTVLNDWQTRYNVSLYLEPGEAVALDAGWLTATVLDIVEAEVSVVILNVSITCHMPDVLEMPYRPPVFYQHGGEVCAAGEVSEENSKTFVYRLAGPSRLAGDVVPYLYSFSRPLERGDRLIFGDMAIYTMVKSTTFNGIRLPSIARFREENISLIRSFGYEDFRSRLS